jgi:D-cysteine desulfhydrase family pyridoxal phosphate-dependent enzyme
MMKEDLVVGLPVDLSRFAKVTLGRWPTPLEDCPRLSKALGGPRILVKRDDVNGLGVGGNKLRKLEFLLGAALADGADTIITFGGLQTNHGRQTAAACARLGLRCELVLTRQVTQLPGAHSFTAPRDDEAYERSGNIALDLLYGARLHVCDDDAQADAVYQRITEEASREGRTVATLPVGGSNALGVLGYAAAAAELQSQLAEVDRIVCPVGSAGTAAGLAIGTALLRWPVTVDAASVSDSVKESLAEIERLVGDAAALLSVPIPVLDHVRVTDRALGSGYGLPTPAVWEAIRLFGRTEGITLDPVYTGKAAAALIDAVCVGDIPATETVVFLHTGGLPGLFGYAPELIEEAGG